MDLSAVDSPIGRRVIIVGQTCTGKSTLGERLAVLLDAPFVELDALHWKPGWVASSDEEFEPKIREATAGEAWVTSGDYHRHTRTITWPRAETVIWLDLPLRIVMWRVLRRSWRRWRNDELLWGTNREKFWQQLKLWSPEDSLIAFAWGQRRVKHDRFLGAMADPQWGHIRFVRLRSAAEIQQFTELLKAGR